MLLDEYLSLRDLARELGITPRTIQRWETLGEGPPTTRIGRKVYYARAAVSAWLKSREQQPA
jgi:predicted DNA-binding transcriptional regulator AlpA